MSLVRTGVSLVFCPSCAVDKGVPLVLEEFEQSGSGIDEILLLDCGSIVDFELLALVVPDRYVPKVRYAQCFDMKGVLDSFDSEMMEKKSKKLTLIVGLRQMLDREKLIDFSLTHKLLNEVMLSVRKYHSLEGDGEVVLMENEAETASVIDYYVDARYQVRSGKLNRL